MSNVVKMPGGEQNPQTTIAMPLFLQREETAAQIVALMQAKFSRPGPDEMREILKCAELQTSGLQP